MHEALTRHELAEAPNAGSLRLRVEALASRGVGNLKIAVRLGTSLAYVENVVRVFRQQMRKPEPLFSDDHVERDETYWRRCLAQGGFPTAYAVNGQTFHVYPSGGRA